MKKTKIAIWYTAGYSLNQGDRAILSAIIERIRDYIPDSQIWLFSPNTREVKECFGIEVIPMGFTKLINQIVILKRMDILLWGGGNMLQESSFFWLPYQMTRIAMAMFLGIPVMIYGMGAGPFRTRFNEALARFFCNKIKLITLRDEKSRDLLLELGVENSRIRVTADPAIVLTAVSPKEAKRVLVEKENITDLDFSRPIVGISVRRWFNYRFGILPVKWTVALGLWPQDGREKFENFKEIMARACNYLIETYKAQLLFIPMYPAPGQRDDLVAKEIIEQIPSAGKVKIIIQIHQSSELKGIIGLCDMFIGVRMHSTILATSSLVPTIAIFYAHKGKEYFKLIGHPDLAIDISELSYPSLKEKIDYIWENGRSIKNSLEANLKVVAKKSLETDIYLKQILEQHI